MAVLPLEALPLGFRFRPTDEELVSHYLKRKITGEIRGEREVIPEIDVCKCEPWDLPDKSLIRSDDPEWFFFAPKDRKYPNGSRSNRATEKGYWKATGKDRIIKSRGPPRQQHMIGMKKTLVFHKGRAPRGERTHWIMHEYRTTEAEFDSGDQGGYVLYKLFRKSEDSSRISDEAGPTNLDEVDRSGNSPAPSRSSPDAEVIQADADVVEEITAPVLQKRPAGLGNGDKVPVNAAQNQVQDLRSQFFNANNNNTINNNNDINNINNDIKEENNLNVDINDYLNSVFMNLPNDESPHQLSDCPLIDNNNFDNNNVNNNDNFDEIWDGVNIDDILMNVSSDTEDQNNNNYNLSNYENAPPLPYDCSDPDVVSFDSAPDPFQDVFTLEESSIVQNQNYIAQSNYNNNNINNNIYYNINNEGTGIMIQPRQHMMMTSSFGQNEDTGISIRPRGFNNDYVNDYVNVGRQGEASRRMRLQTSLKIGTCLPCEENEGEKKLEESNNSDAESAESIVIDKLEESSVHDDDDDSPKRSEKNEEIKEKIEDKNEAEIKTLITPQTVSKKRGLFGYFAISGIIIFVAILCSLYNNNYNYVVNYV